MRTCMLSQCGAGNAFLIFDCPGQLELYTYDQAFKTIVDTLTNAWHCRHAGCSATLALPNHSQCSWLMQLGSCRLAAVSLMDAQLCTDAGKYMAALLASLSTMLHLELPHINLLSKADLIPTFGELAFDLSYYLEVLPCRHHGTALCIVYDAEGDKGYHVQRVAMLPLHGCCALCMQAGTARGVLPADAAPESGSSADEAGESEQCAVAGAGPQPPGIVHGKRGASLLCQVSEAGTGPVRGGPSHLCVSFAAR